MGRSKFNDLLERVQGARFLAGFERICLYGSPGYGKSHILAALACKLIREKKRVLYVPDCVQLLQNFEEVIRTGLYFTCYESVPLLQEIQSARNADDLIRIWKGQKDIYFIVDHLNTLEPNSSSLDATKIQVRGWLNKMSWNRQYIFSASGNERSNLVTDIKHSSVIRCIGGMNQVCLCFYGRV